MRPWDALIEVVKKEANLPVSNPSPILTDIPSYLKQSVELHDSADPQERKNAVELAEETVCP
jgi:hypothetical protein